MYHIFVVSDGTGRTAELALKAALTQFSNEKIEIKVRSEIRSEEQILQIVQEAVKVNGIIVHTLVTDELRKLVVRIAGFQNIETVDIMGPLVGKLSEYFSVSPSEKPGLYRELNEAYFRRIDAMEFAIRHDDGQRFNELTKAEIIILGVSRTFKTPLSIYLAFKGWFVANMPIILDIDLPDQIFEVPAKKIIALTTNPQRLSALRRAREDHLKKATGDYAEVKFVQKELEYAMDIFRKNPHWHRIEVTNKPIEEIASEILDYMKS